MMGEEPSINVDIVYGFWSGMAMAAGCGVGSVISGHGGAKGWVGGMNLSGLGRVGGREEGRGRGRGHSCPARLGG